VLLSQLLSSLVPDENLILLADDNEVDVLMTRRAFHKACLLNPFRVVSDGQQAMEYLSGQGKYANRIAYPLPQLILLDLKMPYKTGLEILEWIQGQPTLRDLRVVVLTESDKARDIDRAYQLGAVSFLVKPVTFENLVRVNDALKGYWLWRSEKPPRSLHDARHAFCS